MKNKTVILIVAVLVTCWSCSETDAPPYPVFKAQYVESFHADHYFNQLDYIPLKGGEQALFIEPTDIEFFQGKWYIFDQELKRIICFYEDGNHAFTIDAVGRGPGEYILPEAMVINRSQNEIWLLDLLGRKYLQYDSDGNYIDSEPVGRTTNDIVLLDDNSILAYDRYYKKISEHDSIPPGLYIMDSKVKPKKHILTIRKHRVIDDAMTDYALSRFNDTCYFLSASDSLIAISEDRKVHVVGLFDFGKFHMPLSLRETPWSIKNMDKLNYTDKVSFKDQLVPDDLNFFMRIGLKNAFYYAIIDRKTNVMKISQGFSNNLGPGPFVFPIARKNQDELVGFISADYILALQESLESMNKDAFPEGIQFLQNLIDESNNNTGNMLVIMKLKKQK